MTTKNKSVKQSVQSMYAYDYIENGKLVHIEKPVTAIDNSMLLDYVKADKTIDEAIISSLFAGAPLMFHSGSAFVKAINENRAKGTKAVTKNDVKAAYDKFQAVSRILELSDGKPLQSAWNNYTAEKIAEREAIKKENAALEANGEKGKTLTRVTPPTVNGILAMLKPAVTVDHLEAAIKSMKTAYNHFLELKGKKAQQDSEKLAALIVSNGGEI